MRRSARSGLVWGVAAVVAALACVPAARALEELEDVEEAHGELTDETREKLARRVTIEEGRLPLAGVAEAVAEQTGLSFVASALIAQLPEPVALVARDVPAGELIEAVSFAMGLECEITPHGIVVFRMDDDDPRREVLLRHVYRMPPPGRGPHDRRGEGPPPQVGEREAVERAREHPKVRAVLDKFDADLVPEEFIHEKRVWALAARRAGKDGEPGQGPPIARVYTNERGEVVHMEMLDKKKPKGKPHDREAWERKRLEMERRKQKGEWHKGGKPGPGLPEDEGDQF